MVLMLGSLDAYLPIITSFFLLFLPWQIRLRDYGVLDFDAGDARRQPPVDTTWQQVLCPSILILYLLPSIFLHGSL